MTVVRSYLLLSIFMVLSANAASEESMAPGAVVRGEWHSNIKATVSAARKQHVPVMIVLSNEGCTHCMRLSKVLDGIVFNRWRKDRNIFMAAAWNPPFSNRRKYSSSMIERVIPFFRGKRFSSTPIVYVYWPKADGTEEGCAFAGRRGEMGGQKHDLLSMELMSALDQALNGYFREEGGKHLTLDEILAESKPRKISYKAVPDGKIEMTPQDGILKEGKTVLLEALPTEDAVFIAWKNPTGKVVSEWSKLEVTGAMSDDSFIAEYRKRSEILPPVVQPAETSICIRVGEPFKYAVKIDEKSKPVSFHFAGRLPLGVKLNQRKGSLEGRPKGRGSNVVDIVINGNDVARTVVTNRVRILVLPSQRGRR